MLKLKHPHDEPPGGWWYRDPDMDVVVRSGTLASLVEDVQCKRRLNKLELTDELNQKIEHQICLRIPLTMVNGTEVEKGQIVKSPAAVALHTAAKRTQDFMSAWRMKEMSMCDPQEAERRAAQCLGCGMHSRAYYCIGCNGFDSWIYGWLGGNRRTSHDKKLTVCHLDGCILMAMVHASIDVLKEVMNFNYPDTCWKRKDQP